jgi:hypothetical protein
MLHMVLHMSTSLSTQVAIVIQFVPDFRSFWSFQLSGLPVVLIVTLEINKNLKKEKGI